jgi:acetyltransferase-like isoleucine patch superfamily enzyme
MAPDNLTIGKQVIIGMNCWIACNGEIGEGVLISSYVGIVGKYDHDSRHIGKYMSQARWIYDDDAPPRDERHAVHIEPDVWIGFGVTILSGIRVGRGSIIAAGSIVTKDVAPYTVVAGNPARQISVRMSDAEAQIHEDALRVAAS